MTVSEINLEGLRQAIWCFLVFCCMLSKSLYIFNSVFLILFFLILSLKVLSFFESECNSIDFKRQ